MRLKLTFAITILFFLIVIFFSAFGGTLRDQLSPKVSVVRPRFYQSGASYIDNAVPSSAINGDPEAGDMYVWIAVEDASSGESCHYAYKADVTAGSELDGFVALRGVDRITKIISETDRELTEGQRIVVKES